MRLATRLSATILALLCACAASAAEPRSPFRDCAECPEMVLVPAGAFVMGTPGRALLPGQRAEGQATPIRIARAFAIGRFEVTRHEFAAFVDASGYEPVPGCLTWDDALGRYAQDAAKGYAAPGRPRDLLDDQPVSCVSWTDARAYLRWLAHRTGRGYRLPSEAEWEYAARAGSSTLYPWGDAADQACEYANLYDLTTREAYHLGREAVRCRDGYADVAPVGALRANAFGLFDMIGNVAEWVEDCYTDSYTGRPRDARAWVWAGGCSRHVQRGGHWHSGAERARSAQRESAEAGERSDFVGFRVALDPDQRAETR